MKDSGRDQGEVYWLQEKEQNYKNWTPKLKIKTLPLSYTTVPDVQNDAPIKEKMVAVVIPVYKIGKFLKG